MTRAIAKGWRRESGALARVQQSLSKQRRASFSRFTSLLDSDFGLTPHSKPIQAPRSHSPKRFTSHQSQNLEPNHISTRLTSIQSPLASERDTQESAPTTPLQLPLKPRPKIHPQLNDPSNHSSHRDPSQPKINSPRHPPPPTSCTSPLHVLPSQPSKGSERTFDYSAGRRCQ